MSPGNRVVAKSKIFLFLFLFFGNIFVKNRAVQVVANSEFNLTAKRETISFWKRYDPII